MTPEEILVSLLRSSPAILAATGDRIWPVIVRATSTFPVLTYARAGGEREYSLAANVVRRRITFVVRCWAKEYAIARELTELVAEHLDRNAGIQSGVLSVSDGEDIWLQGMDIFGCTLNVEMEVYS